MSLYYVSFNDFVIFQVSVFVCDCHLQAQIDQVQPSLLVPFCWTPEAEQAFCKLKTLFTSAPILVHPDPSLQFIVEVDASDTGVGAVLSQRSSQDQKVHPCAFFSQSLDIGDSNHKYTHSY